LQQVASMQQSGIEGLSTPNTSILLRCIGATCFLGGAWVRGGFLKKSASALALPSPFFQKGEMNTYSQVRHGPIQWRLTTRLLIFIIYIVGM